MGLGGRKVSLVLVHRGWEFEGSKAGGRGVENGVICYFTLGQFCYSVLLFKNTGKGGFERRLLFNKKGK